MASTRWVANRVARWLGVLFLAIVGGVLVVLALTPDLSSPLSVTLGVIAVVALVLAVRYLRAGVKLGPTSFVSRGDFWTRELRWSDVTDIEVRGFVVGARLKDGRWLPLHVAQYLPPERDGLVVALRSGLSGQA